MTRTRTSFLVGASSALAISILSVAGCSTKAESAADVKSAPAYTLNGTTRKGGFVVGAGVTLDVKKLQKVRNG